MTEHPATSLAIAVHGGGGGAWEWDLWLPELKCRKIYLEAINLEPEAGRYDSTSVEDYVHQVVEFSKRATARVHTDRVDVLIGASMGGVLVLKVCEYLNPRAIILVCSCLPLGVPRTLMEPSPTLKTFPPVVRWASGSFDDTVSCLPGTTGPTSND